MNDRLLEHLQEQMQFLRASAAAFDQGEVLEAKRLSTALRILLHQTKNSNALLSQLGILTTMEFFDSAGEVDPANLLSSALLTAMTVRSTGPPRFTAMLDNFAPTPDRGAWRPFEQWWNAHVVKDTEGVVFSRRKLVLAVAHQDGGAHVDELKKPYEQLSRSNSLGWVFSSQGEETPLGNPVLPSVRQIAYEVERSICRALPSLAPRP